MTLQKLCMLVLCTAIFTPFSIADAQEDASCNPAAVELIRPFIGTWGEYRVGEDGSESFIGTLRASLDTEKCLLFQKFTSSDSDFIYLTYGEVVDAAGLWEETYVFSSGGLSKYHWIVHQGDVVQRRVGGSRPIDHMHQLRLKMKDADSYEVIQERSRDGGKSWVGDEVTRVKRIE